MFILIYLILWDFVYLTKGSFKIMKYWDVFILFMAIRSQARDHSSRAREYSWQLFHSTESFPSSPALYNTHINSLQNQ